MLQWLTEAYGATATALELNNEGAQIHSHPDFDSDIPEAPNIVATQMTPSVEVEQIHGQTGPLQQPGMPVEGQLPEASDFLPNEKWDMDADFVWYMSTLPSLSMDINELLPEPLSTSYTDGTPTEPQISESTADTSAAANAPPMDDEEDTEEDDTAEVTHQFSDRLGTLLRMPSGEWRFYSATSNLHLVHGTFGHDSALLKRRRLDPQTCLEHAGVGNPVDNDLISHLINLYFTWQNTSLYIVDQTGFESARMQYLDNCSKSGLYSELLVNAM